MTDTQLPDHPNVRYAVAAAIGYAACELDPDTTDDDMAAVQASWPTNISLEAMLIGKEIVVALAAFNGWDPATLYGFADVAMPDGE